MILSDTGPLYALIDRKDAWHERVRDWWAVQSQPVSIPITVLPEVCYLLQTRISAVAESAFVRSVIEGEFRVEPLDAQDLQRTHALMTRYSDLPLGFVDASVVALAERLQARAIITTDRRHFGTVRETAALAIFP